MEVGMSQFIACHKINDIIGAIKEIYFVTGDPPLLMHDSACCHVARPLPELLAWWQQETLEHPSYSLDMSSCYFDLAPKMNKPPPPTASGFTIWR
jgi:hypothetical protein